MTNVTKFGSCKQCGKVFHKEYYRQDTCCDCSRNIDGKIVMLKSFIETKRKASLNELSEYSGIDGKSIIKMITEGKLRTNKRTQIKCKLCNTLIDANQRNAICINCRRKAEKDYSTPNHLNKIITPEKSDHLRYTARMSIISSSTKNHKMDIKDIYRQENPVELEDLPNISDVNPHLRFSTSKVQKIRFYQTL